jgi:hypothetical protein
VQAAPFNAFIQGSMARIAALPHVYHWDFISSELFVVMPFVLLLVGVRARRIHPLPELCVYFARRFQIHPR